MPNISEIITSITKSVVFHNYSHLTIAQIAATIVSFCIYPYVIRSIGADAYGLYVFALSVVNYLVVVVSFGLDYPAVKAVAQNINDKVEVNKIVSNVYITKFILTSVVILIYIIIIISVPLLRQNIALMIWVFFVIIAETLTPNFYFQGIQQMHYISYSAVGCRIVSIFFIYGMINSSDDIVTYAAISSVFTLLSSIIPLAIMFVKQGVRLTKVDQNETLQLVKNASPFFLTNVISSLKTETATILIGAFLGMRDVALYDLANKIVAIPRIFTQNINKALFPNVVSSKKRDIKKIMKYEYGIGITMAVIVCLLSYPAVMFFGGAEMQEATFLVLILSISIITFLIVGSYIAFIFVPANQYTLVAKNQTLALVSFLLIALPSVMLFPNIYIVCAAMATSGIVEIAYCHYITSKNKL